MLESAHKLAWNEECIFIAQEVIEASPVKIARFHYILAKSVLGFYDLLNMEANTDDQTIESKELSLQYAIDNLIKAVELSPGDDAMK